MKRFMVGFILLSFRVGLPVIVRRTTCLLGVLALACTSVAQGQVIEQAGLPVKGNDVSRESFSLSCPSRLVVEAGESLLLSCTATAVPEEGVRYEWESASDDGLRFLSDTASRSPFFTAPVPGAGAEYTYRLTATGPGVYRTATVTVSVEGASVETAGEPGLQEDCDPLAIPEEPGQGCAEDRGPVPFGFGFEEEENFLLPEAPGVPDRGGGTDLQAPPRLECPVAVFLEELETGAIECHAWDAAGEQYLEYSWEPTGNTTRAYLDNPRLIPEDSPTPSVVVPEMPSYETLESFRSGDRTFRYRYRLTATSRATGLSSHEEVEVYVSSSRPVVYCPLEVAVEEGETVTLDCEGADPLSFRMDYDEEEASVLWEWEGLWGTSTAPLDATELSSPLFTAPVGSAGKEYHYIASMTSSASGAPRTARRRVTVRVLNKAGITVTCTDPSPAYEGATNIELACEASGAPGDDPQYAWSWSPTTHLTGHDTATPTFDAPETDRDTTWTYTATASAENAEDGAADITVTVLNKAGITVTCTDPAAVYEGAADVELACEASGAPGDDPQYAWSWSPTTHLTDHDTATPMFDAPETDRDTTWTYTATASAENAEDGAADVTVTVLNKAGITVTCTDPSPAYEGATNIELACEASGAPGDDPQYTWSWSPTTHLTDHDTATPTFDAPETDRDTTWTYTATASAENAEDGGADVTVTVLNKSGITVTCTDPGSVYEGATNIELACEASGAPGDDPQYAWSWSPTTHLTDHDTATPTFDAPETDRDTTWTYTATASAENVEDGAADVTVTVLNKSGITVTCTDPAAVYEGAADVELACEASGAPGDDPQYAWSWSPTTHLTDYDTATPTFDAPETDRDTTWTYTATASAENVEDGAADVTVTVLNKSGITVTCTDPAAVYEGAADVELACEASGAPGDDPQYAWSWSPTTHLTDHDTATPTFDAPETDRDTTWTYTATASAENAENGAADVTVTVLNGTDLWLFCINHGFDVNEGSPPFRFDCFVLNADHRTIRYAWTPRGNTPDVSLLERPAERNPLFRVPADVPRDTTFEYFLTVSSTEIGYNDETAEFSVNVRDRGDTPSLVSCVYPDPVYEGSESITLACEAPNAPAGATYRWTGPDVANLLKNTDGLTPTFTPPANVDYSEDYQYKVTMQVAGSDTSSAFVIVTVLEKPDISSCINDRLYGVKEGDEAFRLVDCLDPPQGAPGDNPVYRYRWTPRGVTPDSALDLLSSTEERNPLFTPPNDVQGDTFYEYLLTISADNADDFTVEYTILIRDANFGGFGLVCEQSLYERHISSEDFEMLCEASGAPADAIWEWTARKTTQDTDRLSATDIPNPVFDIPDYDEIDQGVRDLYFYYTVSVSAGSQRQELNIRVHIRVRTGRLFLCSTTPSFFEGDDNRTIGNCYVESFSGQRLPTEHYEWEWTPRGTTQDTDRLSATDIPNPVFDVPESIDGHKRYQYTIEIRWWAGRVSHEVSVVVLDYDSFDGILAVACTEYDHEVYEGSESISFDCEASGGPEGVEYSYRWEGNSLALARLEGRDGPSPTFRTPDEVDETRTYEYVLVVEAENTVPALAEVTVTVRNKEPLAVQCASPLPVYEGSEDIVFDCKASGAPEGSTYEYVWEAGGDTPNTDRLITGTDGPAPTFDVPEVDEIDNNTTYEYLLTASAENAEDGSAEIAVTVLKHGTLLVLCASPLPIYEGSEDIVFDCEASGAPEGSTYEYVWTALGDTPDTALLVSGTDGPSPTFATPGAVEKTTTYEYLLTVSAENAESNSAEIAVTVLNKEALAVSCPDPIPVYEGSEDIVFDCEASGAPEGSAYEYVWTGLGDTPDTALLVSGTDGPSPTFATPGAVDETTTYEYLLTASAENAESGSAEIAVTVLDSGSLFVLCANPGSVYEGSPDIVFECSASGAPEGSAYEYAWAGLGDTPDTALLVSGTDGPSPTFATPDEVDATTTYKYLLTVSAEGAGASSAEVSVTVVNKEALVVSCADPGSAYEGSPDIVFDCSASGAPEGSVYEYVWMARGDTPDTALLSRADIAAPTFYVPDEVAATTTYKYLLTANAENAESGSAEIAVTVLDSGSLLVTCADPGSVYEGSPDIVFDCSASGAPEGSVYEYAWEALGDTPDTALLSRADIAAPTFYVPDEVAATTTYEYLLTASAEDAESGSAEIAVTVLDNGSLLVTCADPGSVYEGSPDIVFDCSSSGAPEGSAYEYVWTARGDTPDTALLVSGADGPSPTFATPDEVAATTTYEYLLTVSAANAAPGSSEVTVTVLNKEALAVTCADPGSVYEGSEDIAFDCEASGAPEGSAYEYVWTARGDTPDTALLNATNVSSPTFYVPNEVDEDQTYEYLLTVSAENAESGSEEVAVTVLNRIKTPDPEPEPEPEPEPVSPPVEEPPVEPSPPLASSPARAPSDPSALGVTVSASPLRFGVQSADTQVSLDPVTDGLSTHASGLYHSGRMTLAPDGSEPLNENGEMDLSIELASPVVLRREGGTEASLIMLSPAWSFAESCEQLSSQTIGGLYTEVTLSEDACRLFRFGGELDLTDVPSGQYTGSLDLILRSGEREETFAVEVMVTVVPAQRVITIGPGGVRFNTSRVLSVGLTEEQNLSIYPDVAFLTEGKLYGVFELSNPSLIPLEVSVSARFGYTEATENGREVVVEDIADSTLGDLSEVVDIHPGVLVLQPGEKGFIRYGVTEEAHRKMAKQGYAAFFDIVSAPRQYAALDRMPEQVTGDRTARVTMRIPGVYVPEGSASRLQAELLSITEGISLFATFLVEALDRPFMGEVIAYDGDGRKLGRRETLVYTRSRVRVPLSRKPDEDAVFLRFAPRGADRVPLPVTVPWDAPRRNIGGDIGDAGQGGRTPTENAR